MVLNEDNIVTPITRSQTLRRVALLALVFGAYACLALWKSPS